MMRARSNPGRTTTFIAVEDPRDGDLGWQWLGRSYFDPVPGELVAHDLLEHPAKNKEDLSNEWMALGAILWLRVETGKDYRYDYAIAFTNTITQFLVDYANTDLGAYDYTDDINPVYWKRTRRAPTRPLQDEYHITRIMTAVRQHFGPRFDEQVGGDDPSELNQYYEGIVDRFPEIVDGLRRGYRYAQRRYAPWSGYQVYDRLFAPIADEANKALALAKPRDRLIVNIDAKNLNATVIFAPHRGRR